MYFFEVVFRFYVILMYTRSNYAFGGDKSTWSIQQFEGLGDLYVEIEKAAPVTPDYDLIETVCDKIKKLDSYRAITAQDANDFRSEIRGQLKKVKNPPLYVTDFGCRRYKLKTKKRSFIIDLYRCSDRSLPKRYALSFGYKRNRIFFLFATDRETNESELRGLVRRDTGSGDVFQMSASAKNRPLQELKPEIELQGINPVCDVNRLQKFQTCLLLLNTPYYRNKYILSLSLANVNQSCRRVIVEKDWSDREGVERYAFPCWVRPVSNPWIKFINMPDEPSRPLYLHIDYKKLIVHTYRTVEQGEEFDIVHFDADLKTLLLKDLFFILKQAVRGLKKLTGMGSKKDND